MCVGVSQPNAGGQSKEEKGPRFHFSVVRFAFARSRVPWIETCTFGPTHETRNEKRTQNKLCHHWNMTLSSSNTRLCFVRVVAAVYTRPGDRCYCASFRSVRPLWFHQSFQNFPLFCGQKAPVRAVTKSYTHMIQGPALSTPRCPRLSSTTPVHLSICLALLAATKYTLVDRSIE